MEENNYWPTLPVCVCDSLYRFIGDYQLCLFFLTCPLISTYEYGQVQKMAPELDN